MQLHRPFALPRWRPVVVSVAFFFFLGWTTTTTSSSSSMAWGLTVPLALGRGWQRPWGSSPSSLRWRHCIHRSTTTSSQNVVPLDAGLSTTDAYFESLSSSSSSSSTWTNGFENPDSDVGTTSSSSSGTASGSTSTATLTNSTPTATTANNNSNKLPTLGEDGLFHIETPAQHAALLQAHPDSIVVLKVFAPWCRACKGLEPKFLLLRNDPKYQDLPLLWADLSVQHNKEFVKSLGVLALPTVQFYVAGQLQDSFPCGPSKVPILKKKVLMLLNQHIDPHTRRLKPEYHQALPLTVGSNASSTTPLAIETGDISTTYTSATTTSTTMPAAERKRYTQVVPYLREMNLADQDAVLDKAVLTTFDKNTVIMREGDPGRTFFMIRTGRVEVYQAVLQQDPLIGVSADYLGTVINRLEGPTDYFGERALITGEPRAASIRAMTKVTAWLLDKDDFPASSVLSGQSRGMTSIEDVNDKYGVSFRNVHVDDDVYTANQQRGSVNTPQAIRGVDFDEDYVPVAISHYEQGDLAEADNNPERDVAKSESALTTSTIFPGTTPAVETPPRIKISMDNDGIFATLTRLHMIRRVGLCLQYIRQHRIVWGDSGSRQRRNMLVARLAPSRRAELLETFRLLDKNRDGEIELLELQRAMESIGEDDRDCRNEQRLLQTLQQGGVDGRAVISMADFMGLMAEAEFFFLFRDVFSSLDTNGSGYVKAKDLDRLLSGVRDLIADDRKSLIDVEDTDMHIDYERFARTLLGTTLA